MQKLNSETWARGLGSLLVCSLLLHISVFVLLSVACSQSVGHPADTILAPFTRVCWPQPAFVVCILNAQQRGIPFGPVVSWNKPSATAPLSTWPEERGQAQIKWIHILYGPQQRIHSFCCPAVDRITLTHKTFLWVPLMPIRFTFWCFQKVLSLKIIFFFQKGKANGLSQSPLRFHFCGLLFPLSFLSLLRHAFCAFNLMTHL